MPSYGVAFWSVVECVTVVCAFPFRRRCHDRGWHGYRRWGADTGRVLSCSSFDHEGRVRPDCAVLTVVMACSTVPPALARCYDDTAFRLFMGIPCSSTITQQQRRAPSMKIAAALSSGRVLGASSWKSWNTPKGAVRPSTPKCGALGCPRRPSISPPLPLADWVQRALCRRPSQTPACFRSMLTT